MLFDGKMGPNDGPRRLMLRLSSFEQNRRQSRSGRHTWRHLLTEDSV
jgi:hypothetical protein